MTRRRKFLLGLLVLGLVLVAGAGWWYAGFHRWAGWSWLTGSRLPKIVQQGPRSLCGQLGVSGGNLVFAAPEPSLVFGTVRKPGGPEQFTYLILFRYGRRPSVGWDRDYRFHSTSDGRKAEAKDSMELNGRRIEVVYRVELDERLAAVANESLTIDGQSKDMSSGRVFLVDLTAGTPAYRQKEADLPAIPSELESTEDLERLAEAIRNSLESQDPEIKAFLR
jgi:hypothetical protein